MSVLLRLLVTQRGEPPLPAVDLPGRIVIGSGPDTQLRLPASDARPEHLVINDATWTARGPISVEGVGREAGTMGALALPDGTSFEIGRYVISIGPAPAGAAATPPQRTESLAREMMRALLGGDSAPSLLIERGPGAGAKRLLPPPEAKVIIGRGDEADWVIADADLSRSHAQLHRTWDGIAVSDLESKNGTRLRGRKIGAAPIMLRHDDLIEFGSVALRFRDPAEQHLRGGERPRIVDDAAASSRGSPVVAVIALGVALGAISMLVWLLL